MVFCFLLCHSFYVSSSIQEKSPEPASPTSASAASLLHPSQPTPGGVQTSKAEQSLKACTPTDTDLAVVGEPSEASAGLQAEWMHPRSLRNIDTPSMNRFSVLIVPLNTDSLLVKAALCKAQRAGTRMSLSRTQIQTELAYCITR